MPEVSITSEEPTTSVSRLEAIHQVAIKPDPDAVMPSSITSSDLNTESSLLSGSEYAWTDEMESDPDAEDTDQQISRENSNDTDYETENYMEEEHADYNVEEPISSDADQHTSTNPMSPHQSHDPGVLRSDPDYEKNIMHSSNSYLDHHKDSSTQQESISPNPGSAVHESLDLSIVKSEPPDEERTTSPFATSLTNVYSDKANDNPDENMSTAHSENQNNYVVKSDPDQESQEDSVCDNHSLQDGIIGNIAIKSEPDFQEDSSLHASSSVDHSQEDTISSSATPHNFVKSFSDYDPSLLKTDVDGQDTDSMSFSSSAYFQTMYSEEDNDDSNLGYQSNRETRGIQIVEGKKPHRKAQQRRKRGTMSTATKCRVRNKRQNNRRKNMTMEEREKYLSVQRVRVKERRRNMTQEERERYLQVARERKREQRNQMKSTETPEEREKRLATEREATRMRRMNMSAEEKERIRIINRDRTREKRKQLKAMRMAQHSDNMLNSEIAADQQYVWAEHGAIAEVVNNVFEGGDPAETVENNSQNNATNTHGNIVKEFDRCIKKQKNKQPRGRHECMECGKKFYKAACYEAHMKIHAGIKPYECEICGQRFTTTVNLNLHKRKHDGTLHEDPYVCDICGQKFTRPYNLKTHQRLHTGEKSYECGVCERKFARKDTLDMHTKRVHMGEKLEYRSLAEKRFLCSECGKKFVSNSKLKEHMRVHTNEKPFQCTYCEKKFTSGSTLTKHIRLHTGEKPFECTVCGKRFTESTHRTSHMRTHTGDKPFECDVCGKKFSQSGQLKTHKQMHSEEMSFECPLCLKRFQFFNSLKAHAKTHTEEKPAECKECGKTFSEESQLNAHTSQMHAPGLEPMPENYSKCHADESNRDHPPVLPSPTPPWSGYYRAPGQNSEETPLKTHSSRMHSPPSTSEPVPENCSRYKADESKRYHQPVFPGAPLSPWSACYRSPDHSSEHRMQSSHMHSPPSGPEHMPERSSRRQADESKQDHPPVLSPPPPPVSAYYRPPEHNSEESHRKTHSSPMHSPPLSGSEPMPENYSRYQADENKGSHQPVFPSVPLPPWSAYYRPPTGQGGPSLYPHYYGITPPVVTPNTHQPPHS